MLNPKWIAFAHDGGASLLRVDMDPAPEGTVGQVIYTDHDDNTVILLGESIEQFLTDFADDLEVWPVHLAPGRTRRWRRISGSRARTRRGQLVIYV